MSQPVIEYDLITSLLADPTQMGELHGVSAQMFEDPGLRTIYEVIDRNKGRITQAIIHTDLMATPQGQAVLKEYANDPALGNDTRAAVDQLFRDGLRAGAAVDLAERLQNDYLIRTVQSLIGQTKPNQFQNASDYVQALVTKMTQSAARIGTTSSLDALSVGADEALADFEFQVAHPGKVTGIRCDLASLDLHTGGIKPGELIGVAAQSGEGKTHMMIHMGGAACRNPIDTTGQLPKVAIFSLEMSRRQLAARLIAKYGKVDLNNRLANPEDLKRARAATVEVKQLSDSGQLIILEDVGTLDQIAREMRRLKAQNGLDLAIVDYAQLIHVGGESKYAQMATISQQLKWLALQLDIGVIMGIQLNRDAMKETRSQEPHLRHIADGLDLLRSCDRVHLLWTPGKHLPPTSLGSWGGIAVVKTDKVRSGANPGWTYFHADWAFSTMRPVSKQMKAKLEDTAEQELLRGAPFGQRKSSGTNGGTP